MGEDGGSPAAAEEPEAVPAGDGANWDEDDELLAMQQEAWVHSFFLLLKLICTDDVPHLTAHHFSSKEHILHAVRR